MKNLILKIIQILAETFAILFFFIGIGTLALGETKYTGMERQVGERIQDFSIKKIEENGRVEMKTVINKKEFFYPEPVIIQVLLSGTNPISGAQVLGEVTPPSGKPFPITFSENILPGWTTPGNGSYTAVVTDLKEDGQYRFKIEASDNNNSAYYAKPFREDLPDSQSTNGLGQNFGIIPPFKIESIISVNVFGYSGKAKLPPLKITTLYASVDSDGCVQLFWQTPPNIGQDGSYEIRYSSQSITSLELWNKATLAYEGKYSSKPGETQEQKICSLGKGIFYFCVISRNNRTSQSEISNDYIVVIE